MRSIKDKLVTKEEIKKVLYKYLKMETLSAKEWLILKDLRVILSDKEFIRRDWE